MALLFFVAAMVVPANTHDIPRARGVRLAVQPSYAVHTIRGKTKLVTYPTPIQHVVVIYMENRSVDNLFAAYYGQSFPGGGTWDQALDLANPNDPFTPLTANPIAAPLDPDHSHAGGFVTEAQGFWSQEVLNCGGTCGANATAYSYVPASDTGPYATMIANWASASHVLQSNEGPSFEAHQYSIAGQSGGIPNAQNPPAPYAAADNPAPPAGGGSPLLGDCYGPLRDTTHTVDMTAPYPGQDGSSSHARVPCAEYPTILDEMAALYGSPDNQAWQYVANSKQTIWAAPMGVRHLYNAYRTSSNIAQEPFAVDPNARNFIANLNGTGNPARPFPALTYITPCLHESDHPQFKNFSDGPQWLAYTIDKIGQSAAWPNTTIVVTWDDWGGFYDHFRTSNWPYHPMPNPYGNSSDPDEWGFRVPLIVISPYVKARAYVSTGMRSQGAILNYIESTFGLNSLGADDMTNGSDNLSDMFDFTHPALPFVPIANSYQPTAACP